MMRTFSTAPMISTTSAGPKLGRFTIALAFTLLLAAGSAFAQDLSTAKIPFAFRFDSKTLPAGTYDIRIDRNDNLVTVVGGNPRTNASQEIITMIAGRLESSTSADSHLVFDKVGDTYWLSEIWQVGFEGALVHATKDNHEHVRVRASKKK